MTTEFEEIWASHPNTQDNEEAASLREHTRRMLAQRWPMPRPEVSCYTCPRARSIVAYQPVGVKSLDVV